ncbi:MAG TPA: alpha-L-fucosidase, partial [Terriglobia bacterium]|nr:alpha-L-fucosidase [Terriglobia bacterium]
MTRINSWCRAAAPLLTVALTLGAQTAHETPAQFQARTQWWREAKFGMFIHWGLYSVIGHQ